MTLSALGIFSAAGAGAAVTGSYDLISTTTLGTASSFVTFSNLGDYSSTYKHLQIRISSQLFVGGSGAEFVSLRFNSDTGNNYSRHQLSGNGSTVSSGAATSSSFASAGLAFNEGEVGYAGSVVEILDPFSTSKNTTVRTLAGLPGATNKFIQLQSSAYLDTSSISSISLFEINASSFSPASRFSLYGIKG